MERSAVIIQVTTSRVYTNRTLSHLCATELASDFKANNGWDCTVVRLPRRLFRGRLRAYHNMYMLTQGFQPSQIL